MMLKYIKTHFGSRVWKNLCGGLFAGAIRSVQAVAGNEAVFSLFTEYKEKKRTLYNSLSRSQRELFEKAELAEIEYAGLKEYEIFKQGFKLGKEFAKI